MLFRLSLILLFLSFQSFSQDYLWPVKAKKEITAVFAEERPGRYHTGVDIRTFGEIGYHLLAIDNGYISRVRTSSKGYGKTLYLQLDDGNVAVYAHLDHFTPPIDNLVSALHEKHGKYTIDHKLEPEDFPVTRGALIGYSGDTGGITGPHLHFELRDKEGQPINPFAHSLSLPDNLPPIAQALAVIPLDENAIINGSSEQQVFQLEKINDNKYILPDTIYAFGNIGLSIKTLDKISGQYFNFGIYSINLLIDAQFIYSMQYDKIDWENASKIYTERSYSLLRQGYGKFYNIFSNHENQDLPFVNSKSKKGYFFNKEVQHDAIIDVQDYAGNKIEIHTFFVSDTLPSFEYLTEFSDNQCKITFNNNEYVKPIFYLTEAGSSNTLIPTDYYEMGNNIFIIKNINPPNNVLQIAGKNRDGISSPASYHMKPEKKYEDIKGNFNIKHYEHGLIISFNENQFSGLNAFLVLQKGGQLFRQELYRASKLKFSSNLLSPFDFKDVTEIKLFYESDTPHEVFKTNLFGKIVYPDSSFNIKMNDLKVQLLGSPNTFFDTTYIWSRFVEISPPIEGKLITQPFFLKPYLIPFNKEVQLNIAIDEKYSKKNIGIYYFNQKTFKWNYLPSIIVQDSLYIKTSILSGEIFAVIEENNPPKLSNLLPNINGTYYSSDINHISLNISDSFSGLEGERDVIIKLNDKPVIFEYNSYQNKIRYPLKYNLKKGEHTLYVQASDRVGNKSIIKGNFFIK